MMICIMLGGKRTVVVCSEPIYPAPLGVARSSVQIR